MSKTILITGASSGFGEACAEKFSESGNTLILIARSLDKLQALAERLQGSEVEFAAVDVSDSTSLNRFLSDYHDKLSRVDVLINSAGLALGLEPADNADLGDWETMIDTNIKGLVSITRALLPFMVERNKGQIVNIGSTAGSWPYPGSNVYGATKAFVQYFSRGLRADLLGKNIRVSNIDPGLAQTNFSNVRFKGDKARAADVYESTKPLTAVDIAEAVYWVTTVPEHVNINAMEIMPVCQAWAGLSVSKDML